jgi:tape measure domain-containing protein
MSKMLSKLVMSLTAETSQFTKGMNDANAKLTSIAKQMSSVSGAAKLAAGAIGGIAVALGAAAIGGGLQALVQINDEYTSLTNRVKLATAATGDYNAVLGKLVSASNASGQALSSSVELFQRMSMSRADLKITNDEALKIVDTVGKLGKISGTLPANMAAGTVQLAQAMSTGRVYAEEFNSILENIPALAVEVAKQFGTTAGQLKLMVKDGELSSKKLAQAIIDSADSVNEQFKTVKLTVADATVAAQNNLMMMVGALDQATGASDALGSAIQTLSRFMEYIAKEFNNTNSAAYQMAEGFSYVVRASIEYFWGLSNQIAAALAVVAGDFLQTARVASEFINVLSQPLTLGIVPKIDTKGLGGMATRAYKISEDTQKEALKAFSLTGTNQWQKTHRTQKVAGFAGSALARMAGGGGGGGKGAGKGAAGQELDRLKNQAESLTDSVRKPLEVYRDSIADADKLLSKHLITLDTYNRAVAKYQDTFGDALNLDDLIGKAADKWMQPMLDGFEKVKDDFSAMADEVNRLADEAQKKLDDQLNDAKTVVESTRTEFEKLRDEISRLDGLAAVPGSPLDAATLLKAKQGAVEVFNAQQSGLNSLQNAVANYGKSFEDAFVNATLKGEFSFKNMALSIIEDIERMALRMLVIQPIVDNIGKGLAKWTGASLTPGGGVSQGGGGSGFFGNLLGGVVKSFLPGFADGGLTPANQPFIVGERGPEIMMMGQSGRVIPNDVAFGGGGGMAASGGGGQQVTVYQTFNVQATDVGSFAAQLKQQSSMIGNIALGHVQYADNKRGRSGVMDRSR